jgi:hypothetical protein
VTTAAENPFAQGRNPRFDKLATRLAHWTWALFALVVPVLWSASLVDQVLGMWPTIALTAVIMAGLITMALTVMVWHVYALCPVCARKIPLDPKEAVARKGRSLRAFHWLADKHHRALNHTLLALLICSFFPYVGGVMWSLLMLGMAAVTYLSNDHLPLQPWCPQCDWDDGGGKERVPRPDPIGEVVS